MKTAIVILAVLSIPVLAFSATIYVPDNYPTIQGAIDASANGDTIIVRSGTYVENIDFIGKAISVKGELGAEVTTIDGNQSGIIVTFKSAESSDSVLEGFIITNGYAAEGGGIYCENSSPTLTSLILSNNHASQHGGGMYLDESSPMVTDCLFTGNECQGYGGGLHNFSNNGNSHPTLISCVFESNSAPSGRGGGIHSGGYHNDLTVTHCTFIGNTAGYGYRGGGISVAAGDYITVSNSIFFNNSAGHLGGGMYLWCELPPIVTNCTLVENRALSGGAICNYGCNSLITNCIFRGSSPDEISNHNDADPVVSHCNIQGGYPGTGNIDADPLFVDETNGDLHLTFPSPCRDTGDNTAVTELYDFEGDPRIAWGGTVDMGADEVFTHMYITGDQTPGGSIQGKFVGLPGTSPVGLFIGLGGVRPTPLPTAYGDLWLLPPRLSIPLVPIPANGILAIPTTIPVMPSAPYDIPMQGLIGLNSDSLTNLCVLKIR